MFFKVLALASGFLKYKAGQEWCGPPQPKKPSKNNDLTKSLDFQIGAFVRPGDKWGTVRIEYPQQFPIIPHDQASPIAPQIVLWMTGGWSCKNLLQ